MKRDAMMRDTVKRDAVARDSALISIHDSRFTIHAFLDGDGRREELRAH
jgi:hypothetical protein